MLEIIKRAVCLLAIGGLLSLNLSCSDDTEPQKSDTSVSDGSTGDGSTGDGSTGDGSTGDGTTGDGGTSKGVATVSEEQKGIAKVKAYIQQLLAELRGEGGEEDNDAVWKPNPGQEKCYERKIKVDSPLTVTLDFGKPETGSNASCAIDSGIVTITRAGKVTKKYLKVQFGESTKKMVSGAVSYWGYLKLILKDNTVATSNEAMDKVFDSASDTCKDSSKPTACLDFEVLVGSTSVKYIGKFGFSGTIKYVKSPKGVTFSAKGSAAYKKEGSSTMKHQNVALGEKADPAACTGGITAASALKYNLPTSCYCPDEGTLSSQGNMSVDVKINCKNDSTTEDIKVSVEASDTREELEFDTSSCGIKTATICMTSPQVTSFEADLTECYITNKTLCNLIKPILTPLGITCTDKDNDQNDCDSCTLTDTKGSFDWETLIDDIKKKSEQVASAIEQGFNSGMQDIADKYSKQISDEICSKPTTP